MTKFRKAKFPKDYLKESFFGKAKIPNGLIVGFDPSQNHFIHLSTDIFDPDDKLPILVRSAEEDTFVEI